MSVLKMRIVNTQRMLGHAKTATFYTADLSQKIRGILSNHIGELTVCIWLLLTIVNDVLIVRIVMDVLSVFNVSM